MQKRSVTPRSLLISGIIFVLLVGGIGVALLRTPQRAHADNTDEAHYDNIPGYTLDGLGNTYIINNPAYIHVQDHIDEAVVDSSGCVHTTTNWDEGGNTNGVYCNGGVQMYNSSNAPSPVDNTNVSINGNTWSISGGAVSGPGGVQVSGISKATALGIDIPDNYLMVADDGVGQHVIKFYDVSGTPALKRTFGTVGGIRAGNPGEVTPTKFWGLTGVGTDSDGNIYVTGSQNGAYIRSFTPDGNTLRWEEDGWLFSDACDFDPASDGQTIYCPRQIFQMDYSKPVGQRWTLKYYTMDLDTYPNDMRQGDGNSVWYRTFGGHRYLFRIDMNLWQDFQIYRFEDGNNIAAPYLDIPMSNLGGNTGDVHVDQQGNIWYTGCDSLYETPLTGVDSQGNLTFGSLQKTSVPSPFNCVEKMYYDNANDQMYLGGGTSDQPTMGWTNGGPVIARYSHWSDPNQRSLDWQISVPFYHNDDPNVDNRHVQIAYAVSGGYLFTSYVDKDTSFNAQDGESGVTRVYRTSDGSYVGRMLPDGTYGGVQGSWIDVASGGTKAMQRANGDILIMREENWLAKQIIYIWHPDGEPTPTPTNTATATPTPTGTPVTGSLVTAINAGGNASGNFLADTDVDQGNQYSDTSSSIDTSGVSNAAPQDVWQTCRWNSAFTYTIPGLTAGASYTVKLDWAELSFQLAGDRQFNVAINGSNVLTNFDVYATAGYKTALQRSFSATADSGGKITIAFTQGSADNPFVNGIEIYSA